MSCEDNGRQLPILSYKINDSGQKETYFITYSGFTNQLGNRLGNHNIKDKVIIANFFFTRCPSICPPMRTQLINIAENFKNENDFLIVSHTIDPEYDTVEILKSYSESTGIPSERWQLVHSSIDRTKKQADQFMTNFKPTTEQTDFYHSSYIALLDKQHHIRGFYNVLITAEVQRLKDDIDLLLR